MKFVHVLNIVNFREGSEHDHAQKITLESLKIAQSLAHQTGHEVLLLSVHFEEDDKAVPSFFHKGPFLITSSLDNPDFLDKRKLPLISDIMQRGIDFAREHSAHALIYSNVDIAVQPHFYSSVAFELQKGRNSLSITRRTIPMHLNTLDQLPEMYSTFGDEHPGDDCFVFSSAIFPSLNLIPCYLGVGWFDKTLLLNCAVNGQPFAKLREEHLTFHIGDDRTWLNPKARTIAVKNKEHLIKFIEDIEKKCGPLPQNPAIWPHACSFYTMIGFKVKINPITFIANNSKRLISSAKNLLKRKLS